MKELEKEKSQEKITLKDLHQVCNELKSQNDDLKVILGRISNFRVKISESDKETFREVVNGLKTIKIPEEVRTVNVQQVEIKDKTRKWLLWFFSCSLLVVALSLGFAFYSYQYEYKPKKDLEMNDKQKQWLIDYATYMSEQNPKTHNKYVSEKPIPQ
jgi:phospholipid N-methyltransferase